MQPRRLAACLLACLFACPGAPPARAETVSKTYSYFGVHGRTLDEIQQQLDRNGPKLAGTGKRHPGMTRMEFKSHVGYRERPGRCEVVEAKVALTAAVILPRWSQRGAAADVRFVWETLAADIRRHEEAHVAIARTYARDLERQLGRLRPQRDCAAARRLVKDTTDGVLARHDAEQARFDVVEGRNFESRILRLLDARMKQSDARR